MANFRKSFNFRSGLQVDDDNFVVSPNGAVGIGTSIPTDYILDVRGDVSVTGLVTSAQLYSGIGTIISLTSTNVSGGIITTTQLKVGSSEVVDNLIGYARTTFVTDNAGVGFHTTSKLGINTTTSPGVADDEFTVTGDATVTGTVTAGTFSGSGAALNNIPNSATTASNINTGSTIVVRDAFGNFYAGIITATLSGTASTALDVDSSANITVSQLSAGIVTASTRGYAEVFGVGTNSPSAQIHVRKTGISSIQLTSDGSNESIITLGRNVTNNVDNGQIRFGHGNAFGAYPYSTNESLDIINYDTGNLNFYLNPSGFGTSFNWLTNASDVAMTLLQSGNLGINSETPTEKLDVGGNIAASGSITGDTIVKDGGTSSEFLKADGSADSTPYIQASDIEAGDGITIQSTSGIATVTATGNFSGKTVTSASLSNGVDTLSFGVSGSTLTISISGVGVTSLTLS